LLSRRIATHPIPFARDPAIVGVGAKHAHLVDCRIG
jgi:hypothetical protein